ncbi:hypothetical protein V8G54_016134 [Vigna mungo]|uniref:Uncharacterized protein n=1 Tax=Vigna mungo TaxID=3915 RepID=A0AAQ3RXK0_VIGMU
MAGLVGQLFGLFNDGGEPMQTTQPRRRSAVPRSAHTEEEPRTSFNNTGTQNMRGLINNTGYTKGNGNGSIVFGFVRGFADMMDGGYNSYPQRNPNMNSAPFASLQPSPTALLNGDNQKLIGITNNTNLKVKGDGNGACTLGNFK